MRLRVRQGIDRFFALPADAGSDPSVALHFRRNFLVNAADGTLWLFGTSFVSVNAILPVYATKLTTSPLVIGLIPALTDAGWFLPQLFTSPYVERLRRKLPAVALLGALERVPYLALAAAALWVSALPQRQAVAIFLAVMIWRSLASGLVAVPWQELIASVIPVSHRGLFFGISNLAGQSLGVAGAAVAAAILERLPYPHNFALSFLIGFLGMTASYVFILFTVEPKRLPVEHPRPSNRAYLERLGTILRGNANFRTYLISRWLWYLGSMAVGFVAVFAVQRFSLPDSQAAIFTAILFGSGVLGYAFWGRLGDRVGHKRVLELSGTLWIAALLLALFVASAPGFYVIFALMGFGSAGGLVGDLNIAMEFGPDSERPTYIGLARTITGPALFLAPLLAGAILEWASYRTMFAVSLVLASAGLAMLWIRVVEPRSRSQTSGPPEAIQPIGSADAH